MSCCSPFISQFYDPPVPFTAPIGPEIVGRSFRVTGIPTGGARFSINFMCGPSFDHDDIAFSFDVRFNYGKYRNQVHRSNKVGGKWATSEKHQSYFPFSQDVPFEVVVSVEDYGFKVEVNRQHFLEYQHKVYPVQRITHFCVLGDVRLSEITF